MPRQMSSFLFWGKMTHTDSIRYINCLADRVMEIIGFFLGGGAGFILFSWYNLNPTFKKNPPPTHNDAILSRTSLRRVESVCGIFFQKRKDNNLPCHLFSLYL